MMGLLERMSKFENALPLRNDKGIFTTYVESSCLFLFLTSPLFYWTSCIGYDTTNNENSFM